jgi:uncharacterized membrane protein
VKWTPASRLGAALTGALALGAGLRRGGVVGSALELAGAAFLVRALSNRRLGQLIGARSGAVDFLKTLHIHAPLEEVFAYFSDFRNFPRFMSHVRDVRVGEGGRSHWVVAAPAGTEVEWDAEVTRLEPNHVVAWRTLPGAEIQSRGVVEFDRNPDGSTRMQVRLSYTPPAGSLGHAVAALFGKDPKHAMDDDLFRFKSLLEH